LGTYRGDRSRPTSNLEHVIEHDIQPRGQPDAPAGGILGERLVGAPVTANISPHRTPMIQPADSRARNIAIIVVVVGAAMSAVIFALWKRWLGELDGSGGRQELEQLLLLLGGTLGVGVLGLVGLGVFCFRLGQQVCREGRFPPTTARFVKATRVHIGERRGALGKVGASTWCCTIVVGGALAVLGGRVIVAFGGHAG